MACSSPRTDLDLHLGASDGWQRVGGYSKIPALIAHLGTDPAAVLDAAELSRDALARPDSCVAYAGLARLLVEAAKRTGHEHFGLLAGRMWQLADLGMVGQAMRNCRTVGESLHLLTMYQHLNCRGGMAFVIQRSGIVDFGYAIYDSAAVHTSQLNDAVLAAGANFLRELCGPTFVPTEVHLPHFEPELDTYYRHTFRVRPHFDAEYCAMRFPAHWLDHPIAGADPAKCRLVERVLRSGNDIEFLPRIIRALHILLLNGKSAGDDLALMLSMHRRTLNRQLQAHGTTFQETLDHVRFTVARQLLRDSQISLDEVAATLGYASVTPFMRTFQRWSGTPPGRWRREHRDVRGKAVSPTVATEQRARSSIVRGPGPSSIELFG
jgi:AraC-like DNA-binding protein